MKVTIVCYVGDYVICKKENGDVFNLPKEKVVDFKVGDVIDITKDGKIEKEEEKEEKYYICDDVVIFYND
jgi:hypothetical protein